MRITNRGDDLPHFAAPWACLPRVRTAALLGIALLAFVAAIARAEDAVAPEAWTPALPVADSPDQYDYWVADCLVKVFPEQEMPESPAKQVVVHAARGEFEGAQIALRLKTHSVGGLHAVATELKQGDDGAVLPPPRIRYVDSVPIQHNSWRTPEEHLIPKAPAWVPDVLYDVKFLPAWKDTTRCIWLTFDVPADANPGIYTGEVTVLAHRTEWEVVGEEDTFTVPVSLHVHDVEVPARRSLKMTNWVFLDEMARWNGCEFFDDQFWELAKTYAENMASHRQNMIMTSLYNFYSGAHLVDFLVEGEELRFDFTYFDRWVQIFLDAGFDYIEGSHLGWIDGTVFCFVVREGKVVKEDHLADSPEAERYLSQFLPALQAHLDEKGWLDIYYQHMRDEPTDEGKALYNTMMELRRKYAPRLQTIEATHSTDIEPPTIAVPLLSHLHERRDFYKSQQEEGKEVWFYTACGPNDTYANRFLDLHLLNVRYMHWLNFKYDNPGYLCWGFNYWGMLSPFTEIPMTWAVGPLPPGDSYIVYPTPHGLLDSIRWETLRDGVEDYELLRLLQARHPAEAERICNSMVLDFDKYILDVDRFRAARLEILTALEQ